MTHMVNSQKSTREQRDKRRLLVSRLRLRGLSYDDIVKALEVEGYFNPRTGLPFSRTVVEQDIKKLRAQFIEEMGDNIKALRAGQLAELKEVKRELWRDRKWSELLKALEREAKLLGLDAPKRLNVELPQMDPALERIADMSADQLERLIVESQSGVDD